MYRQYFRGRSWAGLPSHLNLFWECFTHKRCRNCCLISLSNLNCFSHIYTSSDAYFQFECTGNIFGAGLRPVRRCAEPFQFIPRCFTHKRCWNCCIISLSNLNRFSHIYTSSDAYFQSECTGSIFGAGLGRVCKCAEPFQYIPRCFTHKRCWNCCIISLSNLNRFSHIYTSSDAYFQSECTGSIFGAGLRPVCGSAEPF